MSLPISELRLLDEPELKNTDEFILSYSQMRARSTAEDFQVKNVENWFWNNDQAVNEAEQDFVTHRSELIPLTERKKPILRRIIEHLGADRLARMFPARHRTGRVECETTTYSSNRAIDAVMAILIVGLGVTILLGPMWYVLALVDLYRVLTSNFSKVAQLRYQHHKTSRHHNGFCCPIRSDINRHNRTETFRSTCRNSSVGPSLSSTGPRR